ncbi:MAG: 4Fe-4S dicluster domain-containing protein [Heliobacteriaceae bacterium]|nr:4Fe-4S dicluster domain-containing protein [Heliobacteriaceae bacterium]
MKKLTRRDFFKRSVAAGVAGGLVSTGLNQSALAATVPSQGTFYDLTKCDGCPGLPAPACVRACREENRARFPQPAGPIEPYWPKPTKEDWSDKKDLTNRLTPYNWTFVQKVTVEHQGRPVTVAVPRRCMHCDHPPCAGLCPFGVINKTPEGPVVTNQELCFGGAKCRDVCPWGIPARQAGVGIYLQIAPKYLGAGVMYKCDGCYRRISAGKQPACVAACPQGAVYSGEKQAMLAQAKARAREIGGFIYGEKENGGTAVFYVSPVPFEKIDQALLAQKAQQPNPGSPGFPGMPVTAENYLDSPNGLAGGFLVAPVAGAFAAGLAAYKTLKGGAADGGKDPGRGKQGA